MQVSLNKVIALQTAINDWLHANECAALSSVQISVHADSPTEVWTSMNKKLKDRIEERVNMITTLFQLRQLARVAQDSTPITSVLHAIAECDRLMKEYTAVIGFNNNTLFGYTAPADCSQVVKKVTQIEAQLKVVTTSIPDSFSASVVSADVLENASLQLASIKRKKAVLREQLTALNVTTMVTLDAKIVALLEKNNIL